MAKWIVFWIALLNTSLARAQRTEGLTHQPDTSFSNYSAYVKAKKNYPNKEFITSSLEDLDLEGEKNDLAFCYTIFEHIHEDDMSKAVEALKRVAKKAILVEPINIKTKFYCHNHEYEKWFKIIKSEQIGQRRLMVIDLE